MNQLAFSAATYRYLRDRIRAEDPAIDERTLADTVEGLTDLHEIIAAVVRSALDDEALAGGLKVRIDEMQLRHERLAERAAKRRQLARDVMSELNLTKITTEDFTVSIRLGVPSLVVVDEAIIPPAFWEPRPPKLNKAAIASELKGGAQVCGAILSNPEPILSVRTR